MERHRPPVGVLLVNLGTPDAPTPRAVRRYLREFLGDRRVLDLHPVARWLLLHLVILPVRPRRSAEAYRKVWSARGSPLLAHGLDLRDGLAAALGAGYAVALGMRYGRPSLAAALDQLEQAGAERLVVVPLFPQYSAAATGSALAAVYAAAGRGWDVAPIRCVGPFYDDAGFVGAAAAVAREALAGFSADHVLFSYHGLPERQIRRSDPTGATCLASPGCCDAIGAANRRCYRAQCLATTRALAAALGLRPEEHSSSFQSRLGRTPWIRPYTDEVLPELAKAGVRRLAVLCPAFAADCLETLEEIGLRAREQWLELGGEELLAVPCPNAHPAWVETVAGWVRAHAAPTP